METKLEKIERILKDENDTLEKLLNKRNELDLLIKRQQELVWEKEEEIELLRKPVVMQPVCPTCKSESITKASGSNWCDDCGNVWRQTVA